MQQNEMETFTKTFQFQDLLKIEYLNCQATNNDTREIRFDCKLHFIAIIYPQSSRTSSKKSRSMNDEISFSC